MRLILLAGISFIGMTMPTERFFDMWTLRIEDRLISATSLQYKDNPVLGLWCAAEGSALSYGPLHSSPGEYDQPYLRCDGEALALSHSGNYFHDGFLVLKSKPSLVLPSLETSHKCEMIVTGVPREIATAGAARAMSAFDGACTARKWNF